MTPRRVPPFGPPAVRMVLRLLALAIVATTLCWAKPASSAAESGLIVVPHSRTQPVLSYFKLQAEPGQAKQAGTLELRNATARRLRVALTAVDGETLSTLGSGYASPGSGAHRSTQWLRLGEDFVVLAPHEGALVPVSVVVPGDAAPGDYLSGVSIEALDQVAKSTPRAGISIASVDRYVIGVEVSLPGPRDPLISFTGAEVQRQPAAVTFLLLARNPGNVILQDTHGRAVITEGRRTVASVALGPGTFVTGTSIAYPIPAPSEHPTQGAVFRVRAYLSYAGGIARLDTLVRFGRAAALRQQAYGGPKAPTQGSSSLATWLVAGLGGLLAIPLFLFLLLRRRREGLRGPEVVEEALQASREGGEPLSLITVAIRAGGAARRLAPVVRSRLRHSDELCLLDGERLLVVALDTKSEMAEALAEDLLRHCRRAGVGRGGVAVEVHVANGEANAVELLQRVREADGGTRVPTPV